MTPADRTGTARERGNAVEDAALAMLQQHGLQLVERNVHARGGEIDLIMRDHDTLIFVEVRHRSNNRFGGGAASVDARKRNKLVHAARLFLASNPTLASTPCRFDVVDGLGDATAPRLHWIRDAFRADEG